MPLFLFFLMIRRPPRSTLFPTRRSSDLLITLARRGDLHARRLVERRLKDKQVTTKLFAEIGKRFTARPGGYTRIAKSSEEHPSELQAQSNLVSRLLLEKTQTVRAVSDRV